MKSKLLRKEEGCLGDVSPNSRYRMKCAQYAGIPGGGTYKDLKKNG